MVNGPWLEPYRFKKGHIGYGIGVPRTEDVKRKISEKNTKYKISKEELENLYYKRNMTLMQIAKFYGVSYDAIYRRIIKYKIKVRRYDFVIGRQATEKQLECLKLGRYKGKNLGKPTWNKGRTGIYSEETINKFREARMKIIIPRKDTYPEILIQKILEKNNIKFETHKPILGQPDIFIEPNICIFVDGCFWHGCEKCFDKNYFNKYGRVFSRIRAIKVKDILITQSLINKGYIVLRFWEHEIKALNENELLSRIVIKNGKM